MKGTKWYDGGILGSVVFIGLFAKIKFSLFRYI